MNRSRFSVYFPSRLLLTALYFLGFAASGHGAIRYEVSLAHPEKHVFHVTMEIPNVDGQVTVQMPAWNALYQIRDFSAHVQEVQAFSGNDKVSLEKIDKQTWRITGQGKIIVRYATFWNEAGPFAAQLNMDHAFINPALILMYVPERRSEAVSLALADVPAAWRAESSAHRSVPGASASATAFASESESYDALADTPIEAGKYQEFQVPGISPPIWVVVHGDGWNKGKLQEELRRICAYQIKTMEGAPFERFVFFFHIGRAGGGEGGGMEHADSTAISVREEDELPSVAAHEFFHLWNVKRIRPETLDPVDYTKEQYTRALWFAEGVTSTYEAYTLLRTQLWDKGEFYGDLSNKITELEGRPANRWQSAEQSSLDAWLEKYPLYERPERSISYYTKGQLLGVLLDILIRDRTDNEKSLDDVLRTMNEDFGKQNRPYRDSLDIRRAVEKVAGGSFEDFFEKYVAHAEALPYRQTLALAGLDLRTIEQKRASLGFVPERDASGALMVSSVEGAQVSGPAAQLQEGDRILAWNGGEPPRDPERWVFSQKPRTPLRLKIRRDSKDLTVELRIGEVTETGYIVNEDQRSSERARRIREGIQRGTTQPVTVSIP